MAKSSALPKGNIAQTVANLVEPIINDMHLQLWDVEFKKEGIDWNLTILIDKPGGVSLNDCEAVSRAVDPVLDETDPIEQSYYLQVFSPGIDRKLNKPAHFEQYLGKEIMVKTIRPVNGSREFQGVLTGFAKNAFTIETPEDGVLSFELKETSFVRACDKAGF